MPPELLSLLELDLPLHRRDPHYFLPTTGDKYLLFGSDREATRQQFTKFFSQVGGGKAMAGFAAALLLALALVVYLKGGAHRVALVPSPWALPAGRPCILLAACAMRACVRACLLAWLAGWVAAGGLAGRPGDAG